MKKSLLALVIASAMPLSAVADIVVYGKANVSVQNSDEGGESQIELVSNASRIGVKGGEDITSGLKVIYQFEYQTEVDDGNNSGQTFGQRNIYVGLQGSAGTVMGGKFDTPVKAAQEKIDLFNDLEGDINYLVEGETRANNIVQYVTPAAFGPFVANLAYVAVEDNFNPDADDGITASFAYSTPELYLAIAAEQDVTAQGMDIIRLVGRYTFDAIQLGALYEESQLDSSDWDGDAWLVSAKYNFSDKIAFKVQYGDATGDYIDGVNSYNNDGESLSVGVDYSLSKNATLFSYYTEESFDSRVQPLNAQESSDDSWLGIGLDLKF